MPAPTQLKKGNTFARTSSGAYMHLATDDAIEAAWRAAMWTKASGHGINDLGFVQPHRPMSAIGG
ncbi:MAG: hypothetical protein NVSMB60_10310 [Mycobacterium sp.]